jgi:A-factor type gamma-butyrolactone 1'-reductase (1S-forming)
MIENLNQSTRRLEGKVAIITGASSGIGAATGRLFAREGASVVLAARRESELANLVKEISASGGKALAVRTDVADGRAVEGLVQRTLDAFGRLDIAFNNAGVEGGLKPLIEYSQEEFERVIATNLTGVFLCMKYEIPAMLASPQASMAAGGGAIVNSSSTVGLIAWPGLAAYTASKHGMVGLTKTAALDYGAKGIRVNAIAPSTVRTERIAGIIAANPKIEEGMRRAIPLGRIAELEEVAETVLWLCSDGASFINGVTLPVDGGQIVL